MASRTSEVESHPPARVWSCVLVAFFGTVLFLRLWLVNGWGSPIPFWDQWEGQGLWLYRPWLDGSFHWDILWAAHNEHRIVLTRVLDLFLLVAFGEWPTWWQMVVNALLNALTAVLLLRALVGGLGRVARSALVVLAVAVFASPGGWQNALWGFQSQCYLVNGFAVLAILGWLAGPAGGGRWWLAALAVVLALFSQASGVFAPVAIVLASVGLSALARLPIARREWIGAGCLLGLVALGLGLAPEVPGHAYLKARSVAEFGAVFARGLAYPFVDQPYLSPILYFPACWFVWTVATGRRRATARDRVAFALVCYAGLQAAAIAYSRGAGLVDYVPLSRYQDGLTFGLMGNAVLLLGLCSGLRRGSAVAAIWMLWTLLGLSLLGAGCLTYNLRFKTLQNQTAESMVAAYRATHDPAVFETASPFLRPHPSAKPVVAVLEDPVLRPVLPPELRGGSPRRPWVVTHAPAGAVIAVALFIAALAFGWRTGRPPVSSVSR